MRPKTGLDTSFQNFTKGYPGPGTYEMSKAYGNKNGQCILSKFKSPAGTVISRSGRRFDNATFRQSVDIPGPGMYTPKLETNSRGQYVFQKWKNSGAPVFPRAQRTTNLDTSATRKSKVYIFLFA